MKTPRQVPSNEKRRDRVRALADEWHRALSGADPLVLASEPEYKRAFSTVSIERLITAAAAVDLPTLRAAVKCIRSVVLWDCARRQLQHNGHASQLSTTQRTKAAHAHAASNFNHLYYGELSKVRW